MAKQTFKAYSQGQVTLFPPTLEEKVPKDSPARLINQIVDNLDLSKIFETYKGGGNSAYHPRMMLKIILYSYLSNIYSSRKIEQAVSDRISFMWLASGQLPDHNTINRFRSLRLKDSIHDIFTQVVVMLVEMGYLSLEVAYIDGTKIESRANRYTFVWRKSVEKHKERLESKIRNILEQVEEGIAQDNTPDDEPPTPINSKELRERIAQINREHRTKSEQKAIDTLESKYLPKLAEYERHLDILDGRNSYSKTDHDATFMRLKDDHMGNGQLKPAYNVQISTENQFITHYGVFFNPGDTLTLIPFLNVFQARYDSIPLSVVADAGYGSEENYEFLKDNNIIPYVKFNYFHKEQKRSFKRDAFHQQNLYYNTEEDYYVCPMGQHMENVSIQQRKSNNGYISTLSVYQAKNCQGCPLRGLCHQSASNRRIEVNHKLNRHKDIVRDLLHSEQGLYHRSKRPVEPETVFGQAKSNKQYNRFRYFDKEKNLMDFAILALALNIGKLYTKMKLKSDKMTIVAFLDQKTLYIYFFTKNLASLRFILKNNSQNLFLAA